MPLPPKGEGTAARTGTSYPLVYLATFGVCLRKFIRAVVFLWLSSLVCEAQFTNGQAARAEIGQQSFTYGLSGISQSLLGGASGIAYDKTTGLLYVADSNRIGATEQNNRIVVFDTTQIPLLRQDTLSAIHPSSSCWVCGFNAVNLYGEIDFATPFPGRDSVPRLGPPNGSDTGSMQTPTAVATDGRYFAVADTDNNRVLLWNAIPANQSTPPDLVLGQTNFTSFQTPQLINANSLRGPQGVWFQNGKLFVADTQNYRILIWNHIPTSNNQPADLVLGQPNFTSAIGPPVTAGNPVAAANRLLNPVSVTSDGTHLFVADLGFNRILIWNSIPTSQDQPADLEIGQPDMTGSKANNNTAVCQANGTDSSGNNTFPAICAGTINFPRFALSDGTRLFVADGGNDRVLIFNHIPTTNFASADAVLGQPDFGTDVVSNQAASITSTAIDNTGGVDTIPTPTSLALDPFGNLYVADPYNRRILIFTPGDTPLPNNSVVNNASEVIRQEGVVVLTGTVVAADTLTITIAGTAYTYTVVKNDTLDTEAKGLVAAINAGSGDPNVTAIFGGAGSGTLYLSSKGTNLAYDAIPLAATTSNSANTVATASGGFLSAGTGATAAPGMIVEINAAPGTTFSEVTDSVPISGTAWPQFFDGAVQVFMDGISTPIQSISPTQIITEVPFWFGDRNSTSIVVRTTHGDGSVTVTNATPVYIAPANPGLYSQPAFSGQTRPYPAINAMHQSGNPQAVVSIDGTAHAADTVTITIAGTAYTYTVTASDTLTTIVAALVNLIHGHDTNVDAAVGGLFNRVVLTALKDGNSGGNGISVAGSASTNAQETVTAYTGTTCCNVTPNTPITAAYPAVPGELIFVQATGLGLLTDPTAQSAAQTGQPYNGPPINSVSNSVSATMNGSTAEVVSAGFTSGAIGRYAVQLIVPSGLPNNNSTQLYIAQNAFISNIVTLPVGAAVLQSSPGTGIPSALMLVGPSSLLFAAQATGANANNTGAVTVTNTGASALTLNSVNISGANAADFSASSACGTTLAAGQTCVITVTYTPTTTGSETATLTVTGNGNPGSQSVTLTGAVATQFEIINKQSFKALDVLDSSLDSGAMIQQHQTLGGSSQRWSLVPVGNGQFAIMNAGSGKVLDVVQASTSDGALIQQYDYLGGNNQKWTVVPTSDGYYKFVFVGSGKVLDVTGRSTLDGALIQQWDDLGSDNQKWQFQTVQLYEILNVGTGLVLDMTGGTLVDGTLVQEWNYLGNSNQQWAIVPTDNTNQYFLIVNSATGKPIDIYGGSFNPGANIEEFDYNGTSNQQWSFLPTGSGFYTIVNRQSQRVLDATGGSTTNGALVQQYDYLNGVNQQWQLIPVSTTIQ